MRELLSVRFTAAEIQNVERANRSLNSTEDVHETTVHLNEPMFSGDARSQADPMMILIELISFANNISGDG